MDRKGFLALCGVGCLSLLLDGCSSIKYLNAMVSGTTMEVPLAEFEVVKDGTKTYLPVIVAGNERLRYSVCVFRTREGTFKALLMRCTHQGAELQVSGDRLHCPAHGSEFDSSGTVQEGPAESNLRIFPTSVNNHSVVIDLT